MPSAPTIALAAACSRCTNGHVRRMKISVGFTVSIAVISARSSAIHFGTSSPSVMWNAVMNVKIKVRFRMPGGKRDIDADGRIAWADRRVGMGVQFERVDPANQAIIDNFVDAHFFSNRKA